MTKISSSPEPPLLKDINSGVLELTLNRPDQLNALTKELHQAIYDALKDAEASPEIRAVLLTGRGRGFCAGQDLGDRNPDAATEPPDLETTLKQSYNPNVRLIRSLPKPVICAVNGVAAGAGANLALGCDILLAATSARFIQAFVKIGLVPDAGGSWLLPKLLGEARAKALAMTGAPLSAQQAKDWGLVWEVYEDNEFQDRAREFAQTLAAGPTHALGAMKLAIQQAATQSLEDQLELEARLQGQCGITPDYREGVRAFLEKRPAKFTGRLDEASS